MKILNSYSYYDLCNFTIKVVSYSPSFSAMLREVTYILIEYIVIKGKLESKNNKRNFISSKEYSKLIKSNKDSIIIETDSEFKKIKKHKNKIISPYNLEDTLILLDSDISLLYNRDIIKEDRKQLNL